MDKVYIFSQKKLVLSTKDTVISLSQMQKTEFQVMRKLFIDKFSNFELYHRLSAGNNFILFETGTLISDDRVSF